MIAEILNVGSELLIGDILNTNVRYLSFRLSELGLDVLWHTTVGDNFKRLEDAVKTALKRSDFIILTGGLGPTEDDITKEVVSHVVEKELVQDEKLKEKLKKRFKNFKLQFTENNYKQSLVIKDCTVFENKFGTAPALFVESNGKKIIMLPGPPEEMKAIFEEYVAKYVEDLTNEVILSKNVYVYGLAESKVDEMVSEFLINKNPTVGIYAKDGCVRLRVTAKEKSSHDCEKKINEVIFKIKKTLDGFVFGVDILNMQNALVKAFKEKGKTLAVAESCTGGLISSKIVEISGSSDVLKLGVVSYSNKAKQHILNVSELSLKKYGAVSLTVAKEMAFQVRKISNCDVGVSTTGVAGPTGGTKEKPVGLVYVGISTKEETKAYRLMISLKEENERNEIRKMAAIFAMNKARQEVLN